ncbi:MAG: DUF308 domain-containing protein [Eubacteriales bacterium]|nr:DUF308 domain-containing protein [Eubacteriales bacterium]
MFETFRRLRRHMISAIILFFLLGIALVGWPGLFLQFACYIIGAVLIAFGVITLLGEFRMPDKSVLTLGFGVIVAAVGIVVITNPQMVSSIIPVVFGMILFLDGISNVYHALGLRRIEAGRWGVMLVLGIVTVALGALILLHPYGTAEMAFRVIGAALVYNALSDLFLVMQVSRAGRQNGVQKEKRRAIDVDVRPVDDDE